jgi:integrase/recombinase XerD
MTFQKLTVSLYARHSSACAKKDDPYWRRCRCPKWLYINDNGERTQRSAKTRSWDRADDLRRTVERELELIAIQKKAGNEEPQPSPTLAKLDATDAPVTLAIAVARFLAAKKKENLADSTISKLTTIFEKQLLGWAHGQRITRLEEIEAAQLEAFRETWKDAPLARKKKQERVIGFFFYCVRMGWIKANPAVLLGRIKVQQKPTDYFTKEEFNKIVDATYVYNPKAWNTEPRNQATRVRMLILLMRWSGLSIGDAIALKRSNLSDKDELLLYRAKTGQPVFVPLPADVAERLRKIPPGPAPNPAYFFWSGNGKLKSAVADWQRSLRRVFELADLKNEDGAKKRSHAHMFRDTFAVECLLSGLRLDEVQVLLGHKSIKTTEKHYAPWVRARQEQLTVSVRKTWTESKLARKRATRANPIRGLGGRTEIARSESPTAGG